MPDENPNLDIRATLDSSGVTRGATTAVTQIGSVTVATTEAADVAALYSTNLAIAERALVILGAEAGKATANIADLDAAMDLAQAEAVRAAEANALYAKSLAVSVEAMIDADAAAEALVVSTAEEAAAAELAAEANELDAAALAKRAIMMRRASDGLVDIALGGRRAIQGVTDLQYVLTGLFPEGTTTIAIIAGIALIGELWERASTKMAKDSKDATDKMKANVADLSIAQLQYKSILDAQLESQKLFESSQQRQLENARAFQAIAEKQLKIDHDIAIEKARQQELIELGNTTDEGEKNRIKARFKATETDINTGTDVASAQAEVDAKNGEIKATSGQISTQRQNQAENESRLDQLEKNVSDARASLVELGVGINDDLLPDKKQKDAALKAAEKKVEDLQNDRTVVHSVEEVQATRDELARLKQLIQTTEEYPDAQKKLSSATDSAATKMREMQDKLDILISDLSLAQQGVELATRKAVDSQVQSNTDQSDINKKNPIRYNSTKPVDDALALAQGDANANTGINSGDQLRQISELKGHIQDAMKAHQDITGFILELIQLMENFKIGSQKDRDTILNALSTYKVSASTNALQ